MTRLAYPSLSLETLTQALDLFRSGQVIEQRALFANLVWNIQGPIQALVFGDPDRKLVGEVVGANADHQSDLEERLEEFECVLERSIEHYHSVSATPEKEQDAKAIDPATILALVNVVLQLIDAWRKRRQSPTPIPQA